MVEQTTTKNEDKIEKLQTFDSSFFKIQFFFFLVRMNYKTI